MASAAPSPIANIAADDTAPTEPGATEQPTAFTAASTQVSQRAVAATPPVIAPEVANSTRVTVAPTDAHVGAPMQAAAAAPLAAETNIEQTAAREALAHGREAAASGDYNAAIASFTKALGTDDPAVRMEALELLGVAREYNDQKAHAKAAWQQYLDEYPDSPDAGRVRQRLTGLITRDLPSQAKRTARHESSRWQVFGYAAQFYRRHVLSLQGQDDIVGIDALFTDIDLSVDRNGDDLDLGARVSGGHIYDFAGDLQDGRILQLSTAYLESTYDPWDVQLRIGRQSRTSAGILGRFDGALLEWRSTDWLNVGLVSGYAVDSSFDGFHADRPFYGLSVETTSADGNIGVAPFIVEQQVDGLTDRRAVGFEARYLRDAATAYALVDYDIYHDALNNAYVFTNAQLPGDVRAYASFDYRRSPYIATQNALIGQPFDDISDLEREFAARDILKLANDRTAELTYVTLGADKDLGERYHVGFDVAYSDFSETPTSGNVSGFPERVDYYYTARIRADEIFGPGSFTSLQLRYMDGEDSTAESIYFSNRFRLGTAWYLYPRIRADLRQFAASDQEQRTIAPSLRLDYHFGHASAFELETGYEWTTRMLESDDFDIDGYFLRAGYRLLF